MKKIHKSCQIFLTPEKSPFTSFLNDVKEKNFQFFSFTSFKKLVAIPSGWGGCLTNFEKFGMTYDETKIKQRATTWRP